MYNQILILCGKAGISIARLERDTGLGNGTIRRWKTGNASVDNVRRVAEYFGVSMDCLLSQQKSITDPVQ